MDQVPVIYCEKGGIHRNSQLKYICNEPKCQIDPILCQICKLKYHTNHKTIALSDFYTQLQSQTKELKYEDDSERICKESFQNLKEYIYKKIDKIEVILNNYFEDFNETIKNANKSIETDIKSIYKITNVSEFIEQVKKVTKNIDFDTNKIKNIKNPIQKNEILKNQTRLLTSFQKIYQSIEQQYQQIYLFKKFNNLNFSQNHSFLNNMQNSTDIFIKDETQTKKASPKSIYYQDQSQINSAQEQQRSEKPNLTLQTPSRHSTPQEKSFSDKFKAFQKFSSFSQTASQTFVGGKKCIDFKDISSLKVNSSQYSPRFHFSDEYKNQYIELEGKYIATGSKDNYQSRIALLEPTLEVKPLRVTVFSFKIRQCKDLEYGTPLAIGICHINVVHQSRYEFVEDKQKLGCYLLSSSGVIRNYSNQKQDKKFGFRYFEKDVIVCTYNPFRKTLQFVKESSKESCVINVDILQEDKLYPCVRISYAADCVEFLPAGSKL